VPLFRVSRRFKSWIISHHSRFTCECNEEEISDDDRESRRCSRDTYPESCITKHTSIRGLTEMSSALVCRWLRWRYVICSCLQVVALAVCHLLLFAGGRAGGGPLGRARAQHQFDVQGSGLRVWVGCSVECVVSMVHGFGSGIILAVGVRGVREDASGLPYQRHISSKIQRIRRFIFCRWSRWRWASRSGSP